jgi:hypothetical protein
MAVSCTQYDKCEAVGVLGPNRGSSWTVTTTGQWKTHRVCPGCPEFLKNMNAKPLGFTLILASGLYLLQLAGDARETNSSGGLVYSDPGEAITDATAAINALGGLLFEFASAQYHRDSARKEKKLMTTHRGQTVKAYTDGKWTVVSIPFSNPTERAANALFCMHYNALVGTAIDAAVDAKSFKDALIFYQLAIQRARMTWTPQRWSEDPISIPHYLEHSIQLAISEDEKKFALLEKMSRTGALEKDLQEYQKLCTPLQARYKLEEIDKVKPIGVPDLLSLKIR